MTITATAPAPRSAARRMLNKVPEVTLYFWVIKILCTTVGETASDYLSDSVGLGLTRTTMITGAALLATLVVQFRVRRYIPAVYWLGIVLISVVGTQITDNLTDEHGVSLVTTTIIFSGILAAVFAAWYGVERTLSIHTIFTTRREAFYWLAVLFTFALGTAAGDLTAERLAFGYWVSAVMFAALIAVVAIAHLRFGFNAVSAFWIAYILTRPLGASLGDFLSQARADGGLGLGTTVTSLLFLGAILVVVVYLTLTRVDTTDVRRIDGSDHADVLVVAVDESAPLRLVDAVRARATARSTKFHVLVPSPAEHAELTEAERRLRHAEGEAHLARFLPQFDAVAQGDVTGSVSYRHDPFDAIEETLRGGKFHEIILAVGTPGASRWLHADLPHRVAHLGLPLTIVALDVAAGNHGHGHLADARS
jgi:uncharacterized membrane-anchored protein